MSGVPDAYYDNERGLIGPCMYRTGGFCNTAFASHGMKFFTFLYPSLSVIIAIHNLSTIPNKRPGGINICIG